MRGNRSGWKMVLSCAAATAVGSATAARAAIVFTDNYNTAATYNAANNGQSGVNYTEADQNTFASTWTSGSGVLTYNRTTGTSYGTSNLLLNSTVASTSGLSSFTIQGNLIAPGGGVSQAGLIISGDNTNGGFVIQTDNGLTNNPFALLRETGGQLLNDEGGSGNPPVLANFGVVPNSTDTYQVIASEYRNFANPTFFVTIKDVTTSTTLVNNQMVVDTGDPANYGGTQIGWRTAREH